MEAISQLKRVEPITEHYGHNVDATGERPYCTDCETPIYTEEELAEL